MGVVIPGFVAPGTGVMVPGTFCPGTPTDGRFVPGTAPALPCPGMITPGVVGVVVVLPGILTPGLTPADDRIDPLLMIRPGLRASTGSVKVPLIARMRSVFLHVRFIVIQRRMGDSAAIVRE